MDLIRLKIEKDKSLIRYIKIIRDFDSSLSIGVIKQRIEENDFVIAFDLEYYDVLEDINEINRREMFRNMIRELYQADAKVSIYQNEELINIEFLDNWLKALDEISQQTECDMERELEA